MPNQQMKLRDYLTRNNLTNQPQALVNFLTGKPVPNDVTITINNFNSKGIDQYSYLFMAYLLYSLKKVKLLAMVGKNNYQEHFESNICPFCSKGAKGQIKSLIRQVIRNTKNEKSIGRAVETFIKEINPSKPST